MANIGEVSVLLEAQDKSIKKLKDLKKELESFKNLKVKTTINKDLQKDLNLAQSNIKKFKTQAEKDTKLKATIDNKQLNQSLRDTAQKLNDVKNSSKAFDELKSKASNAIGSVNNLGKSVQNVGGRLKSLGDQISSTGRILTTTLTVPIGGFLGLSAKSFIDFEDNLANVRKTVGLTEESTRSFGRALEGLSTTTRTSLTDLVDIATIGGQLGIAEKDIFNFTKAIDTLNVALGDEFKGGAEEITGTIGTLRQLFKDIKSDDISSDLLLIGNALNELGASGLATSPVVSDFANRIAGVTGGLKGIKSGDILGLSAALQELGVTAERGGSAIGRIYQRIAQDAGGFARALGLNVKDFTDLVNTDINEAFLLVSKRVQEVGEDNVAFAEILDELSLKGSGITEILGKVGSASDLVREKQALANDALTNTNSILDEYNIKNNTAAGRIGKLSNKFNILKNRVGELVAQNLLSFFEPLGDILVKIVDKFERLPQGVQTAIIGFAGLLAVIGPILLIAGPLIGLLGGALSIIGAILSPIGLLVVALTLVGGAIVFVAEKLDIFRVVGEVAVALFSKLRNAWEAVQKAFQSERVQKALDRLRNAFSKLRDKLQPILDKVISYIKKFLGLDDSEFSQEDIDNFAIILEALIDGLVINIEKLIGWLDNAVETFRQVRDGLQKLYDKLKEGERWYNESKQAIVDFLTEGEKKYNEFRNNLVNTIGELPMKFVNKLNELNTKIGEFVTTIVNKGVEIGKGFAQGILDGLRSIASSIINTINGFFGQVNSSGSSVGSALGSALRGRLGFAKGGVVPQYLANGGVAGKTAYASQGLFTPKGTDTVPAMLTPGELVVPRNLTRNLFNVLSALTKLPNVSQSGLNFAGASGTSMNFNIGKVYATDINQTRKRSGDIGFGVLNYLRRKGR